MLPRYLEHKPKMQKLSTTIKICYFNERDLRIMNYFSVFALKSLNTKRLFLKCNFRCQITLLCWLFKRRKRRKNIFFQRIKSRNSRGWEGLTEVFAFKELFEEKETKRNHKSPANSFCLFDFHISKASKKKVISIKMPSKGASFKV